MVFSSPVFVFLFLPLVYLINLVLPAKFSNVFLLFASLLFYAWGEPIYVFLMVFSGFVNYRLALKMDRHGRSHRNLLILSILFNIGMLAIFKYSDFLILGINSVFNTTIPTLNLPLPIGISFYTFQTLSYVFDVYRGETPVQKNFLSLLLYITFFPQLIAGPIVKYHDVSLQIQSRTVDLQQTSLGLRRFVYGLAKKVLIANAMALIADTLYALPNTQISTLVAWTASIAYALQIYFDFSGYSDMAIGMGWMFGFHFKENFNYPYIATSMQDFWRRWHISLSSWFRLYVYIPLGGNQKGKNRAMLNRILVFFLTGLWHGAAWTFVVWGLYHGLFLLLEQSFLHVEKWPRFIRRIYTLLVVVVGFVIFRSENFAQALVMIRSLFFFSSSSPIALGEWMVLMTPFTFILFAVAFLASTPIIRSSRLNNSRLLEYASYGFALVLWGLCLLNLASTTYNPFIYFRF